MPDLLNFLTQDVMGTALWLWGAFVLLIGVLMAADLGLFRKDTHEIGVRESLTMYGFYMFLACVFGGWVWWQFGQESGANYFTGYFIEQSLSMDNLFVMSMIFGHLGIPRLYQHRVLFWGIIGVILLRGVMILAGAVLIAKFHWILMIFGAFLIYSGIRMGLASEDEEEISFEESKLMRFLAKRMRITMNTDGQKFFLRQPDRAGKIVWFATPLFLALCMIELSDVIFAVDSIPAIFAITTDPFVIFTSNLFAILGLRSLYFALSAVLHRFIYVKYALAAILSLIGVKIFYTEFVGHIDPLITLGVTFGLLALSVALSMIKTRHLAADTKDGQPE